VFSAAYVLNPSFFFNLQLSTLNGEVRFRPLAFSPAMYSIYAALRNQCQRHLGRRIGFHRSPVTNFQSPSVVSFHPVNLLLNEVECRVLGALIEKEITTPEYYPLSLNALVNACNQKSNRDP